MKMEAVLCFEKSGSPTRPHGTIIQKTMMIVEQFRCKIIRLGNAFLQSFIRKRRPGTWNGNNTADLRFLLQNTHCNDNRLGERQHILEEPRSNLGRRQAAVCLWFSTAIPRKSWYVHPKAGYGISNAQPLSFIARESPQRSLQPPMFCAKSC